jgi:hypothetical protein
MVPPRAILSVCADARGQFLLLQLYSVCARIERNDWPDGISCAFYSRAGPTSDTLPTSMVAVDDAVTLV